MINLAHPDEPLVRCAWPATPNAMVDYQTAIATFVERFQPSGSSDPEAARLEYLAVEIGISLVHSDLIYVHGDVADLVNAAADTIPSDMVLRPEMVPFMSAFVVFDTETDGRGLHWKADDGGVQVVYLDGEHCPVPSDGCSWAFNTRITDNIEARKTMLAEWSEEYQRPDMVHPEYLDYQQRYWRFFAAFILLATQKGVLDVLDAPIARATRKRAARHGQSIGPVRVIRLRAGHGSGVGGTRHLTKRFIVRGHWRNQTYGPRGSLRRPTWISPHIKGPDDAPLDTRPTVFVSR